MGNSAVGQLTFPLASVFCGAHAFLSVLPSLSMVPGMYLQAEKGHPCWHHPHGTISHDAHPVGASVGVLVGGSLVGPLVGSLVGVLVGASVVGSLVGVVVGASVVGSLVGSLVTGLRAWVIFIVGVVVGAAVHL